MVLFIPVRCLITVVQILLTDISAARLSYQDEQGWRFKPIYYNREELQLNYTRYKSHNTSLNISFHALNRDFFLNLHAIQPSSIEYTVNENHTKSSSYKSSILVGQVTGLRDSLVTCTVQNGILQEILHYISSSKPLLSHLYHYSTAMKVENLTSHEEWVCHGKEGQSQKKQNKIRAVNEIHYMIRDHMKVLNDVFEGTKFTVNHGKADEFTINGFQFEVDHNFNDYDYEYPDYNYTDGDYNTNTDHNFTDYKDSDYPATSNIQKQHYCLSVLFTARSITHGLTPVPIYGLAYSPNDENPHTGICSPVNVAFVNLYVSEKVPYQPNTMTKLVFAHEVAHTFGAPHDNNKTACGEYSVLKESDAGYFLMHEVAVTGDLRNNFKFSNCSFDKIETVLARETSTSCFKVQAKDLAVVEIPNCNRSVCDLIGWHECELANGATKLTIKEKEELCYVGCQKTKSSQCISTNDASARAQFPELDHLLTTIAERDGWEDTSIRVPVGTPCNRMTGYCDVFQRCRGVDPDTPLSKLKRCFKQGGDCISVLLDFLSSKSGLIILAIVAGVILTFTCLVKCLSIHTKSSNPHLELKHPHKSVRESAIGVRHSVVRMGGSVRYSASHMRNSMRNSFRNSRRQSQTLSRENNRNVNDEDVQELKQLRPE
ncbi:ADA10-like protein [Mya arenaria]|uniref:ADA10-like protein n=1 Tax=Mya arenaria TaxID=6604 RepID=A0ABY7EJX6_MYAAR|nr:ADA10-like protein [Mya arenaria]